MSRLVLLAARQATKTDMVDCWSFTCCLSLTLSSSLKCDQLKSYFVGIILVDVHWNWLNWFHFLFHEEDLLVIPIDCIICPSTFLDVTVPEFSAYRMLSFDIWFNGFKSRIRFFRKWANIFFAWEIQFVWCFYSFLGVNHES